MSRKELERLAARIEEELGPEGLAEARRRLEELLADPPRPAESPRWPGRFGMIGASPVMEKVWEAIEKVAGSDLTVLITGESGTGKEMVARALKEESPRSRGSLVCTNCAAIPETLLEGELFGHVRGAFTGAVKDRRGRFEEAHKGTLFLDEIGEMSPAMQSKLLRVLQDGEVRRVGSNQVKRVDVRLVTATNRDLEQEVAKGRFREDLYFRVAVFPIHLPPLREREGDPVLLARYFLHELAPPGRRGRLELDGKAQEAITAHPWPGNVRELQNCVRRALALGRGERVGVEDLF